VPYLPAESEILCTRLESNDWLPRLQMLGVVRAVVRLVGHHMLVRQVCEGGTDKYKLPRNHPYTLVRRAAHNSKRL